MLSKPIEKIIFNFIEKLKFSFTKNNYITNNNNIINIIIIKKTK